MRPKRPRIDEKTCTRAPLLIYFLHRVRGPLMQAHLDDEDLYTKCAEVSHWAREAPGKQDRSPTHLDKQLRVCCVGECRVRARDADCDTAQQVADSTRQAAPEEGVARVVVARGVKRLEGRGRDELGGEDDRGNDAAAKTLRGERLVNSPTSCARGSLDADNLRVTERDMRRQSAELLRRISRSARTSQKMILRGRKRRGQQRIRRPLGWRAGRCVFLAHAPDQVLCPDTRCSYATTEDRCARDPDAPVVATARQST